MDLNDLLKDLGCNEKINRISNEIRAVEAWLQSQNVWFPYEAEGLALAFDAESKKRVMRLFYGERPLIECKVQERVEGYQKIPAFIAALRAEVEKKSQAIKLD